MHVQTEVLNGQRFTVRRWGDPALPKLLMLHGFPEYGGAWAEVAARLSHRFHCIAPDQRGYGTSYAPPDISAYARSHLVREVADLAKGAPVTVLGHDWGAAVAYGLAASQPALVSRLIVVNGVHPVPFQRAMCAGGAQSEASQYINALRSAGSEDRLAADDFARFMTLFSAKMDTRWLTGDVLDAQKAIWRQSGLRGMIHWYRASPLIVADPGTPRPMPDLPVARLRVHCPHLLICGMEDTALLPQSTEGLEDFAADLTRIEVPGADHWICHQRPDTVAGAILDWVPT